MKNITQKLMLTAAVAIPMLASAPKASALACGTTIPTSAQAGGCFNGAGQLCSPFVVVMGLTVFCISTTDDIHCAVTNPPGYSVNKSVWLSPVGATCNGSGVCVGGVTQTQTWTFTGYTYKPCDNH